MNNDVLTQAQHLATNGALEVWGIIGNFIALIVLSLVLFMFAYRIGKGPFVSLIMSFYVGYSLFFVFPYATVLLKALGTSPAVLATGLLILYIIAVIIPYIIIRKVAASDFIRIGTFALIILSILTAGFLLALAHHALSVSNLYAFPAPLAQIFTPPQYFFWWFIAPLAGLILFAR